MTEETVKAELVIELNVQCPECDHEFDMLKDTDLNDEGWLLNQVLDDDRWKIDAEDRLKCSPLCPKCSTWFDVKGVVC